MYIFGMKLAFYSATDVGLVRHNNQDSLLADGDNRLFIVADGMGGHQGGEVASSLAVKVISRKLAGLVRKEESLIDDVRLACIEANRVIYNEGRKNIELRGMGTTLCLFLIKENGQAYIANIGDSRLYMEKDDKMWLLTEDHNFLTNQLKVNFLSGESTTSSSAEENVLTKSVGFFPTVEPDIFEKTVETGEKYLICSDGLSGFVPDQEIQGILKTCALQDVPKECMKKALDAGGEDNISVIAIEVQ
jgi:protein phosphatase